MLHSFRIVLIAALTTLGLPALAQAQGMELPDGEGKELVQASCVACHQTNLITASAGFTHEQWDHLISKMIDLPDPLRSGVTQYLAANFPLTYDRAPTLVPGDSKITFLEWDVPTLGQRPRDPLMTPDGMIWWAGMYGNIIGRLDPATGEMTEWQLDSDTYPHSIINDVEGNIWYTGNHNGTVGKLDPDTGEITVYPMPDPAARDPHTPVFTRSGELWFTLQNSHMIGRLVPDTGDIRLMTTPTEGARPYGIREDSRGMLWVAYRGAPAVARIDRSGGPTSRFEINPGALGKDGRPFHRGRMVAGCPDPRWSGHRAGEPAGERTGAGQGVGRRDRLGL